MSFDIVFNPRTNKFLAKGVRRVAEVNKNAGHFQMMQVSQTVNDTVCHREEFSGKVTEVCGHSHGFIENEVFFHYSSLVGTHISELLVGTSLTFNQTMNGQQKVAKNVRIATVPELNKNLGHFQMMQTTSQTENVTSEVTTGKVTEICGHTHGFIEDSIFFHYTALIGTHISELSVGICLSFNQTTNGAQKVAKNAKIATVPELNKNLGHFQTMQITTPTECVSSEVTTGKVTEICGHTHGFIENSIFFHYTALVGTHISELAVGTSLSFNTTLNGNQKVAKNVRLDTTPELKISTVPELAAIKTILELEGAKMLRRLSKNLVVNEVNCDKEVESIMQSIKVGSFASRKNSLTPFSDANSRINSRRGSAIGFR